jgi:hypothetical protein
MREYQQSVREPAERTVNFEIEIIILGPEYRDLYIAYISLNIPSSKLIFQLCKIWGFHGGDYEESRLLGCGTV